MSGKAWPASMVWLWALAALLCGCGGYSMGSSDAEYAVETKMAPQALMAPGDADMGPMRAEYAPGEVGEPDRVAPPAPPAQPSPSPSKADAGSGDGTGSGVAIKATPLLIYTANYNLAVFEAHRTIDAIQKLAEEGGGYLVRRSDNSITVRIPTGKFRGALAQISKLGDVLHREESVEDVTERYYDLQVRLKNARAMRDRLEQLLVEAQNVKEALLVEKELARVTADIESMEGKLKLMRELIAYSTITVTLDALAVENVDAKVKLPFPWLNELGLGNLMTL